MSGYPALCCQTPLAFMADAYIPTGLIENFAKNRPSRNISSKSDPKLRLVAGFLRACFLRVTSVTDV
ncbi:MAG: hypothetical protein LBC18_13470, partial [Opitutaceae bacterium]|nr:hypothetical protein [Opitutaceae bacterium]